MTHMEACDLATRVLEVFSGPPAHVWEEVLLDLDAGTAGTAIARLTRTHERRWLSPAEFLGAYRSLDTKDPGNRPKRCDSCDDSGWVEAEPFTRDADSEHPRTYTAWEPCRCPEGRSRRASSVWRDRPSDRQDEDTAA